MFHMKKNPFYSRKRWFVWRWSNFSYSAYPLCQRKIYLFHSRRLSSLYVFPSSTKSVIKLKYMLFYSTIHFFTCCLSIFILLRSLWNHDRSRGFLNWKFTTQNQLCWIFISMRSDFQHFRIHMSLQPNDVHKVLTRIEDARTSVSLEYLNSSSAISFAISFTFTSLCPWIFFFSFIR